jgi:NADH:ubiquinone oxidoreductase subunit 2 (subunit N)
MKQLNQVEILAVNGSGNDSNLAYTNAVLIAAGITIGFGIGTLITKKQAAILAYSSIALTGCLITALPDQASSIFSFLPLAGCISLCTAIFFVPYFAQ